jgi:hypothetical protein
MSCERNPGKIAALAARAGAHRLAGKKAFYVGLAAGATGLVAGGLVVLIRRAGKNRRPGLKAAVNGRQAPALVAREGIKPADPDRLSGDCPTCSASPKSKPGMWYVIGGEPYCQDCAPRAAREAGVNLEIPSPAPSTPSHNLSFLAGMRRPGTDEDDRDFSPARRVKLGRTEGRVRVRVVTGDDGVGRWHFHEKAYLLLDEEGQETGLAITPGVDVLRDSDGDPIQDERGRFALRSTNYNWHLTHMGSGTALAGPYKTVDQAHALAEILAQLDWKREKLTTFSPADRWRIWRTLANYEPGLGAYKLQFRQASISSPHDTRKRGK